MPINDLTVDESGRVTGSIVNALTGVAFEPTTLVFTLYDKMSGSIINSRNAATLDPVTVAPGGALAHTLTRADMVNIDANADEEIHVVHYKWTYNSGADAGVANVELKCRKDKTPTS